ncbi:MAG: hypothetical protein Q9208_002554 [Pyrenodesmia sp. 3 TL-2023]
MEQIRECYDTGKFTDLTLISGGQEFKCHKLVLCSQSPFFEKACTNGFQESQTSTIHLPDDDPLYLSLMLEFFYTKKYSVDRHFDLEHAMDRVTAHIALYTLGDKYEIPALCRFSADEFKTGQSIPQTVSLLETVPLIYTRTSEICPLRDAVVYELIDRQELLDASSEAYTLMHQHLREIDEFREDIFRELIREKWSKGTGPRGFSPISPNFSPATPSFSPESTFYEMGSPGFSPT